MKPIDSFSSSPGGGEKAGMSSGGYLITVANDSDFYIPGAAHIECDVGAMMFQNDEEAAKAAKCDGVPLICGMHGVPDNVYIDTPENREIITMYLETVEGFALLE